MATTVRITETYDLKTTVNKLGLIGIHTPTTALLNRLYPGLVRNHEFVRFLKCDVTGACASVLPADPLQVGVASGDVAPEDMFNPILYKAVTNESFDTLMARITGQTNLGSLGSVNAGEIGNGDNAFGAYYALLADNGKYRKSMPQSGFRIRGLVPICHTLISTYGNVSKPGNMAVWTPDPSDPGQGVVEGFVPDLATTPAVDTSLDVTTAGHDAVVFRGRSVRMPKIPLHYANENPSSGVTPVLQIPNTFVLAMIVPPARLHEFFYRMRVTWTVRFEKVVSTVPYSGLYHLGLTAPYTYYKSYNYSSSKTELENKENFVDTDGVSITKIMES